MTRVKYSKQNNGTLLSRPLVSRNGVVRVLLTPNEMSFLIYQEDTKTNLQSGNASSLALVKKQAKEVLVAMGVQFQPELRLRTPKTEQNQQVA